MADIEVRVVGYLMKGVKMVELVALTGGAVAAGVGIYRYFTQNARTLQAGSATVGSPAVRPIPVPARHIQAPQTSADSLPDLETAAPIPRTEETKEELHRGFNSSSISLGLASTGLLFFPPLQYASIPALIYMGAPSARRAYDLLYERGQPSRALAETAALAICLGGGWYLIGSLGFWLYYVGQIAYFNRTLAQTGSPTRWPIPHSARLLNDQEEVLVASATLQPGDKVCVETSDIVPIDGVVDDGVAWVQPAGSTDVAAYCLKRVGDRVMATDIVIVGRLALRVQKAK